MKAKKVNFKEEILNRCKIINSANPEILSVIAPKNNDIPPVIDIWVQFNDALTANPDADQAVKYLYSKSS